MVMHAQNLVTVRPKIYAVSVFECFRRLSTALMRARGVIPKLQPTKTRLIGYYWSKEEAVSALNQCSLADTHNNSFAMIESMCPGVAGLDTSYRVDRELLYYIAIDDREGMFKLIRWPMSASKNINPYAASLYNDREESLSYTPTPPLEYVNISFNTNGGE